MVKRIIILLLLLSMIACARGQLSSLPPLSNPTDYAELVIFRKSKMIGGGASYNLLLDSQAFVSIRTGDYVRIKVNPGRHVLSAELPVFGMNQKDIYRSDLEVLARPFYPTYFITESFIDYPHVNIYEINSYVALKLEKKYKKIKIVQ